MSGLPDFISQLPSFDPQLAPPYKFLDVSARIFALEADETKLTKLCDKHINSVAAAAGQTFSIKPIQSVVLLEVLTYGKMFSTFEGREKMGYSSQNELFFAIPVALYDSEDDANKGIVHSVGLFTPFLFVDNDWSLVSGRDIVGFPKLEGEFRMPSDATVLTPTSIKARVLDPFQHDTESRFETIVHIESSDVQSLETDSASAAWPFGPLPQLYDATNRAAPFPVAADIMTLLEAAAGDRVNDFTLRQFRDGTSPHKSSYQSVLRSELILDSFENLGLFNNAFVKVYNHASLPLVDILGLTVLPSGKIEPELAFLFQGDFRFDIGETLLTRCGDNTWSKHPGMGCGAIISQGFTETRTLLKGQARVTKNILKRMAKGNLDPEMYFKEMETGCRNVVRYYGSLCKLTKTSLRHLVSRS
jgi:hypothetical protein